MATPTPGKYGIAQTAPTPPVSTPFSSGNRPAPSPAQHFKKSPANSQTLYGHGFAGFNSPNAMNALGMDAMALDMVTMGMLNPGAAQQGEEDKKRRLEKVLDILKTNKGRLSEPGIERLARRVGLECLWEDHPSSGGLTRTLIIAGKSLSLDIDFANNVVKKVSLSFDDAPETVTRHTDKAGNILLHNLEYAPGETSLTKLLDRFAANLGRLAQLDKLSVIPGLNCHEAIAGIYESLEKLHKWEVARLNEQDNMAGEDQDFIERTALSTKSGKPVMHTRDRLGMSLEYWQEKRRIHKLATKTDELKTWSLLIECAPLVDMVYAPVRVSKKWISADILKKDPSPEDFLNSMGTDGAPLDWLEPEAVYLQTDNSNAKYPEVIFVAKFDPPVVVTAAIADQLSALTNATLEPYSPFFEAVLFPRKAAEKGETAESRVIRSQTVTPIFSKSGEYSTKTSHNVLHFEKYDLGRSFSSIPFSHPRQLVEMIPHLRQFVFFSALLKKTFHDEQNTSALDENKFQGKNKNDRFAEFINDTSTNTHARKNDLNVTVRTQPNPQIDLAFQLRRKAAYVSFQIGSNGVVSVVSENILKEGSKLTATDLARMLEITEDLATWVEFVRRNIP